MAQEHDTRKGAAAPAEKPAAGPELRLLDRRAFVGFPPLEVIPGLSITDFALQVPDVSFPFNLTGGALRYQRKKLQFGFLELELSSEIVARRVSEVANRLLELEDLKLHFRPGYLEGQARTKVGDKAGLTFKVSFDGDGESLAVYLYDVRFYGFSSTPAAQIPVLLSRSVDELELLPGISLRGASGFSAKVLPPLCQLAAVSRGFKMPRLEGARLSAVEVTTQGLKLRFASGGLPPPATPDEELLLALEGARAFADAEELIAQGRLKEARDAYLRLGDASEAHPYAAERLLGLLVADPQAHEMALDVAASLSRRRERSAVALWAEAVVRERRGEHARASERYLALCALARKNHEEAAAFFAAEAAARSARDHAPQLAARALHELLGLRPDHLPSLKALARASDQAQDRAGAIRAYRRIAALSRDPFEAAEAHVHLARLSAQTEDDIAGARLHCEAALRLAPDHPEALYLLGELCHRSGEHLRAVKSLDRLREVAMGRHELDRVGRANLLAGRVWDEGLNQLENALLRYREAVSLLPGEPEPLFYAARTAEKVGKLQEALAGYQQTVELAGPAPRTEEVRRAAHQAHHALARLYRTRLGDPARGREHLESAFALDPKDLTALEELIPFFRASGRAAELADACEKAAAVTEGLSQRAAYWAEAGELWRGRLGQPDKAEKLLTSALEADPRNRAALEGMLALAESRRDGGQLCRCLRALAELSGDGKDRVRYYRRLAVAARDLTFDHDLAAHALTQVLALEPDDLPTLGELCALQRKRADMAGLAQALEHRARAAEAAQDKRLAAAALRELAQVLETRLGRVGEALVAMEKAARLSPEPGVLVDLADLSIRCERPAHARRALEDLLASLPRNAAAERVAELRARLGKACDLLGDRDSAIEHYAAAFPVRKLDDELSTRLEALYEDAGRVRDLSELWAARAQALIEGKRAADAAPMLLRSARAVLASGDKGSALLRLNAVLEAAPVSPEAAAALETMAELELERGARLDASRLWARRATLLDQGRPAARMLLKAAQLAAGTSREAALLTEALEQDASFAPARIRRASLVAESAPESALDDLTAALAVPGTDSDAPGEAERLELIHRAASAALRAGQLEEARKYFALYTAERPDDLEATRELCALYRKAGAKESLHELLGKSWTRFEDQEKGDACREYAELSVELGRPQAAAAALRSLLKLDQRNLWAARTLFSLLPVPGEVRPAADPEPLRLLNVLVAASEGDEKASFLERRARLHQREGRLEQALGDLREAAALAKHGGALFEELAELCRRAGDASAELAAWRSAVSQDAGAGARAATRALELAAALLEGGDREGARAGFAFAAGLPLSPDERCEACFGLAQVALDLDDLPSAAAAFLEASRQGEPSRRVEAHLRHAALVEKLGDSSAAAESLEAALALAPRHLEATRTLERVLRDAGEWARLAELLTEQATRASRAEAAGLYERLGDLYFDKLARRDAAESAFRKAARLDAANVPVRERLVALLCERGELEEAAALADEAAQALGPERGVQLLRATAAGCRKAGEDALALKLLRAAHALKPAEGTQLELLADLLFHQGALREALPLQQTLAAAADFQESPEKAEATFLRLADLAERTGDRALAEKALRKVLQQRPSSDAVADRLAALVEHDNPRQAIELLWKNAQRLPASPDTGARLIHLADRAHLELRDVELAVEILRHAIVRSPDPVPARERLVSLLRESARTGELMDELASLAEVQLARGDGAAAIAAYEERTTLAEQAGRIDDALTSLEALREVAEGQRKAPAAAEYERRRAELFRDARLDLDAAEAALEKSHALAPLLATAQMGISIARRREDPRAQARWLERAAEVTESMPERAAALLALGKLYQFQLSAPDRAEAALRDALKHDPSLEDAESLLLSLLESEGRLAELAGYYEESAGAETDPARRAALYRRAAVLYRDRAGRPEAAIAALLAARSATPEDLALTAEAASLLHAAGRVEEASEFDAVLLASDPSRDEAFQRRRSYLARTGAHLELGNLLFARAQQLEGGAAAELLLEAASELRRAGAQERALVCEDAAFEKAPFNDRAFQAQRARVEGEPRRLADLLARRAQAVPGGEALPLLRERAEALLIAGETLLAAEAFDDLLARSGQDVPALTARAELAAQAGGPSAAQLYDRRLLAAGDELPPPVRLKSQLRLGHAALASGAFHDATDAFEAVVALDPEGEKGKEALSLLSEVHARTRNSDGLFRTQLQLAKRARGAEAEALLRRAAEVFDEPAPALDAWLPLAHLRPGEARTVERAAAGLKALGRYGDLVELYEKSASAVGGARAAELLLSAAQVAETELNDGDEAARLRAEAAEVAPDNLQALRMLLTEQRRRSAPELRQTLAKLIALTDDADERAVLRLELATAALAQGDEGEARGALEAIVEGGATTAGYAAALEKLEPMLVAAGDDAGLARVLAARAELEPGSTRSARLLEAARAAQRAGTDGEARRYVTAALVAEPTVEGFMLAVALARRAGDARAAAEALSEAAGLSPEDARGPLWLEAADAFEAVGDRDRARGLIERLAESHRELLAPAELISRLLRLGANEQALSHGFAPAMAEGRFEDALALADAARHSGHQRLALWELTRKGSLTNAERLAELLGTKGDETALLELSQVASGFAPRLSGSLLRTLLRSARSPEVRRQAFERLEAHGQLDPELLLAALGALEPNAPPAFVELLLRGARALPFEERTRALTALAGKVPARRAALLRERFELEREHDQPSAAVATLESLLPFEDDLRARAALHLERAELYLHALAQPKQAQEAFELALTCDLQSTAAVKNLVALSAEGRDWERFVAMADRLARLAGDKAVEPYADLRVEALEALGRAEQAAVLLASLPETPERLERRAALASRSGRLAEALALREKLARDDAERAQILSEYLEADLAPQAVRLGTALLEQGALPAELRRACAERLARTVEGAAFACALWPPLLEARLADADAWTYYAEALKTRGDLAAAELADGFGAVLSGTDAAAAVPSIRALDGRPSLTIHREAPSGVVAVTAAGMPRLHAALSSALSSLGVPEMQVWLHAAGGVEAYLVSPDELVLGAGALGCFGAAELAYLCALALMLGDGGFELCGDDEVEGFEEAARAAFAAVPSSLAASRVLLQLDRLVRGTDPAKAEARKVLPGARAFRALALQVLGLV